MAEGRREEWPMSPGGRDMRKNPTKKSPEMWGDFFELAKKASNSRSSSYMFVTLLFSKGFMWKSCAYSYIYVYSYVFHIKFLIDIFLWSFSGSFLYIFWVFSEPCHAIATWSGKNRRFAKQSNAKLGRFIGCWTSSISTSASTWIQDLTQDGIEPKPGPCQFKLWSATGRAVGWLLRLLLGPEETPTLSLIWSSTFEVGPTFMKDSKFDAHEVAFGEYQTGSWGEVVGYAVGVGVDFFK